MESAVFSHSRDYFLSLPNSVIDGTVRYPASDEGARAFGIQVLSGLPLSIWKGGEDLWTDFGEMLIPEALIAYYTGHSGRHWMPTAAAHKLEVAKDSRDCLGKGEPRAISRLRHDRDRRDRESASHGEGRLPARLGFPG